MLGFNSLAEYPISTIDQIRVLWESGIITQTDWQSITVASDIWTPYTISPTTWTET
jgi:hypothetical protein